MKRPEFKTGNASFREALNLVLDYAQQHGLNPGGRPGWIETKDGWFPPFISPSGESESGIPWDLRIVDSESFSVGIDPGTIIANASDLSSAVTLTAADSNFTVSDGSLIWIDIVGAVPITATLTSGVGWGDGKAYAITGTYPSQTVEHYRYPLWEFRSTGGAGFVTVGDGLFARRLAPKTDLMIIVGLYAEASTLDPPISVPVLIPSHRVIPAP